MPSNAQAHFVTLIGNVDQIIAVHGKLQDGPGRRHEQEALHRAGVVMVIAAWESYVEQIVLEAVNILGQSGGLAPGAAPVVPAPAVPVPAWARHSFALRKAEIARLAKRFHTPDATGVRDLFLETFDFNPWPQWSWHSGPRQWDTAEMCSRLNGWVTIRHCIAHGAPLPIDIVWIRNAQGVARLHLPLLRECKSFFTHVVGQTDTAFGTFITQNHGIPNSW